MRKGKAKFGTTEKIDSEHMLMTCKKRIAEKFQGLSSNSFFFVPQPENTARAHTIRQKSQHIVLRDMSYVHRSN